MVTKTQRLIGTSEISIVVGDMTAISANAYVIPQCKREPFYEGVGGAVARAGGQKGLLLYADWVRNNRERRFGQVLLTPSGGGNAEHHLHISSVGSERENKFSIVQKGFFEALKMAEGLGMKRIVAPAIGMERIAVPAIGTGATDTLTAEQSAKAMMSALYQYCQGGGTPLNISFVIDDDIQTVNAFIDVLHEETYKAVSQVADDLQGRGAIKDSLGNDGDSSPVRFVQGTQGALPRADIEASKTFREEVRRLLEGELTQIFHPQIAQQFVITLGDAIHKLHVKHKDQSRQRPR